MAGTTVSTVQTVLEAVTADHDRRLTESAAQTNRFATASADMAKAQTAAQVQVARLTKEIALSGDASKLAAVQYDISKGALQGVDAATKVFLTTLARQVDLQRAESKAAQEAARSESVYARSLLVATQAARGFSSSMGTLIAGGVVFALGAFIKSAVEADVRMDSLRRGMVALSGSAGQAEKNIKQLRELAKLPGVTFEDALRGSINLQAAGLTAQDAAKAIKEFGNALATAGGNAEDLKSVTLALQEIVAQGTISERQIRMLSIHVS